jgi:hypothetical protein
MRTLDDLLQIGGNYSRDFHHNLFALEFFASFQIILFFGW